MQVRVPVEDLEVLAFLAEGHAPARSKAADAAARVRTLVAQAREHQERMERSRAEEAERSLAMDKSRALLTRARNAVVKAGFRYLSNDATSRGWNRKDAYLRGEVRAEGAVLRCVRVEPETLLPALEAAGLVAEVTTLHAGFTQKVALVTGRRA